MLAGIFLVEQTSFWGNIQVLLSLEGSYDIRIHYCSHIYLDIILQIDHCANTNLLRSQCYVKLSFRTVVLFYSTIVTFKGVYCSTGLLADSLLVSYVALSIIHLI